MNILRYLAVAISMAAITVFTLSGLVIIGFVVMFLGSIVVAASR